VIDSDWHQIDFNNKKTGIKNILRILCDELK